MYNILNVICTGTVGSAAYILSALIVIIAVITEVFAVLIFLNHRSKKEKLDKKQDLPAIKEVEAYAKAEPSESETETDPITLAEKELDSTGEAFKKDLITPCLQPLSEGDRNAIFDEVFAPTVAPIDSNDTMQTEAEISEPHSFAVMDEVCATDDLFSSEAQNYPFYDNTNGGDNTYSSYNNTDNEFNALQDRVRYIRSFTAKLSQSNDLLKERYSILKNELMSCKKAKARMSWHCETFRLGRPVIAKFAIIGKTLSLYLSLSPEDYVGTKYIFKDVSAVKKYSAVPMRLKLKSNRSVRYAKELIAAMAEQNGWQRLNLQEVDYYPEYRTTEELIMDKEIKLMSTDKEVIGNDNLEDINEGQLETATAEGFTAYTDPLAIIIEVDLDDATTQEAIEEVSEEPEVIAEETTEESEAIAEETEKEPEVILPERDFEFVHEVSVTSADKEMTDEKAESLIETLSVSTKYGGKGKAIVNIDTLSDNYKAGEVVTLENLKAKKLIPKKAGSVKVLGRGVIDKPLTVEADGFTVNAVKMILLTGGRAIRTVE